LDGLEHEHDERRVGVDGEKAFGVIMVNLRNLRSSDLDFIVSIRHNFDPASLENLQSFLDLLAAEFGSDERFAMEFSPIGKWGANDEDLLVCEGRSVYDALLDARKRASAAGFTDVVTRRMMQPSGSVCYAANPRSFVIGSDGRIYKCTVELDWSKMALWTETNGMDPGKKCCSCYFGGSCFGGGVPQRVDGGARMQLPTGQAWDQAASLLDPGRVAF
jgi:uncharacterized protein